MDSAELSSAIRQEMQGVGGGAGDRGVGGGAGARGVGGVDGGPGDTGAAGPTGGRVILGGLSERVALPVGTCTVHCSRDALLDTAPRLLVVCGRHAGRGVARCGGGAWGQGRSRRG